MCPFSEHSVRLQVHNKMVPQGPPLGLLLFSIFVNNPQIRFDCQVHIYTDDTVIYSFKPEISQIQHSLQSNFNLVQKWFSSNKHLLNEKKSYSMFFSIPSKLLT